MTRRVAFASLVVFGVLGHPARAQGPARPVLATPQGVARRPDPADVPPPPPTPVPAADLKDVPPPRAAPLPRRTSSARESDPAARRDPSAATGRFANPGGVGRYAEYYTSNTPTSQADLHPGPRARFDQGAGPDRASQIASARAGQQRVANIQNNINAYGRPYGAYGAGFGFGFGLGAGGLYGGGFR